MPSAGSTGINTQRRALRLNLGCGNSVVPGFEGVDIISTANVRYVCDLQAFPWQFEDCSVEEVLMHNVLEHLPDTVGTMNELHRILRAGGRATISVPYYNSVGAADDPTHKRAFSENTMNYFTEDGVTEHSAFNYYARARFRIVERTLVQRSQLLARAPEKVQLFLGHHLATISGIVWVLEAVK